LLYPGERFGLHRPIGTAGEKLEELLLSETAIGEVFPWDRKANATPGGSVGHTILKRYNVITNETIYRNMSQAAWKEARLWTVSGLLHPIRFSSMTCMRRTLRARFCISGLFEHPPPFSIPETNVCDEYAEAGAERTL
jgi:hypothetical protein